jgi:hypothetical protein
VKKYIGHTPKDYIINRAFLEDKDRTIEEQTDAEQGDGAYIFKPEWRDASPKVYGKLNQEVEY